MNHLRCVSRHAQLPAAGSSLLGKTVRLAELFNNLAVLGQLSAWFTKHDSSES